MPAFVPRRYQPGDTGTWSGHLAFASELIQAIQPELLVELGTHWGESYFCFCQTIADHGLSCSCYAVDHWHGERHSGEYGEEVYNDVRRYNEQYYKAFSYLVRSDFSAALGQFSDESIDLLHIDGLHTYEACSHDFWSWLPKVKPGGIVLLHDICARHADFGLWRLWEEINARFTDTFEFRHSWGLGVVRKPGGSDKPEFLRNLFQSTPAVQEQIRRRYAIYASHLENLLLRSGVFAPQAEDISVCGAAAPVQVRVRAGEPGSAKEPSTCSQVVTPGEWTTLSFELPPLAGNDVLQLLPSDRTSIIEIREVSLYANSGVLLSRFSGAAVAACFSLSGTVASFRDNHRCLLFSYGSEPVLAVLSDSDRGETPGRMEITMRIDLMPAVTPALSSLMEDASGVSGDGSGLPAQLNSARAHLRSLREKLANSAAEVASLKAQLEGITKSKSWRVTAPLRRLTEGVRNKH